MKNKENEIFDKDRGKAFFGVVNFPKYDTRNYVVQFLDLPFYKFGDSFVQYAYILHDHDKREIGSSDSLVPLDTKEVFSLLKTPHVHFLVVSPNRRRVQAVYKEIALLLGVPLNCVSCQVCQNISSSLQYRIHYQQPEKFQYNFDDIRSSNYSWLVSNFRADESSFTFYLLGQIEKSQGDYISLIQSIGVSYGRKYKDIIYNYYKFKGWFK